MASSKPRILVIAIGNKGSIEYQNQMHDICLELSAMGYSPEALLVENNAKSDDLVKRALALETFALIQVGGGVRSQPSWHKRIKGFIAQSTSRDAVMAEPNGPQEAVAVIARALPLESSARLRNV